MTTIFSKPQFSCRFDILKVFHHLQLVKLKVTMYCGGSSMIFWFHFSGQSGWLRRLCWARAMVPWLVNGAKSRNVAPVSLLGMHWQGQKAKNGITLQDTSQDEAMIKMRKQKKVKKALLSANPTPPWIQMLLNFAIYAINCSNGTRT